MSSAVSPISQMQAFEELCRTVRSKRILARELSEPEQTKIVGMIAQGRDVWASMSETAKNYTAMRYSTHAGVRRAIHAVPELYELFQTYQSPHVVVESNRVRFFIACQMYWQHKVTNSLPQAYMDVMLDDICAMWEELPENQKDRVLEDYFRRAHFRRAIKEIPEVFGQFRQEKLLPLWQQVTRMRKDALVHLCLHDDYILRSAQESEMIDFVGQHYELMLAEHDAAYWDRFWQ